MLIRTATYLLLFLIFCGFVNAAEPSTLVLKAVPAEKSGLTHAVNSDPQRGEAKYPWMSPPVDINGDGNLDIIVYGHHGGGAAIWLGDGKGEFKLDDGPYNKRWVFGGRDPVWWDLQGSGKIAGLGTEGTGIAGVLFINDGAGMWTKTELKINNPGFGDFQWADLDGDGYHRELFLVGTGTAMKLDPPVETWPQSLKQSLHATPLWEAEKLVGWPDGIDRGKGPARAGYRDMQSVDLDGDDRNELIVHFRGSGFDPKDLFTWVLDRDSSNADKPWVDRSKERGLPQGNGHWLCAEDLDADGDLDLVDFHAGHWHQNDGHGKFTLSKERVFDPGKRPLPQRKGHPWTTDNEQQWLDMDNNGHRDLLTASDHGTANGAFLNLGGGKFVEAAEIYGTRRNRKFGDIDADGRLDMVTFDKNQVILHHNESPKSGLSVKLVPARSPDAHLGAKLWTYESGRLGDQKAIVHYRQGVMERSAGRSTILIPQLHVGIGDRKAVALRVRFPSGVIREVASAKPGEEVTIREVEP